MRTWRSQFLVVVVAVAGVLFLPTQGEADIGGGSNSCVVESGLLYPGDTEEVYFYIFDSRDWVKFKYKGPKYSLAAVFTPSFETYQFFSHGSRKVTFPEPGEYSVLFVAPPPSVAKKAKVLRVKVKASNS